MGEWGMEKKSYGIMELKENTASLRGQSQRTVYKREGD